MHRILFLVCLAVACNNAPHSSTKAAQATSENLPDEKATAAMPVVPTDSAIAYIRHAFQQINAAPLKRRDFEWEVENCGEGTATYYLTSDNEIVKVVETGAIGDGSWTIAYYYQGGRFLFSLETNIGGPAIGPVDTFTIRKYVYQDRLIRMTANNTSTPLTDSVLTNTSKEYQILEAYKTKNFGAAFCE